MIHHENTQILAHRPLRSRPCCSVCTIRRAAEGAAGLQNMQTVDARLLLIHVSKLVSIYLLSFVKNAAAFLGNHSPS